MHDAKKNLAVLALLLFGTSSLASAQPTDNNEWWVLYKNSGDTITYRIETQPSDVKCVSMLENNYQEPQAVDAVTLNPNAETKITFSHHGVVLLQCRGMTEEASLNHLNTLVPVHIVATTTTTIPVFILGINSLEGWKNLSQENTPNGQTLLFDGRTRYYMAAVKLTRSRKNRFLCGERQQIFWSRSA